MSLHSPGVVEHHGGQVLTGLGQIRHREAERGEEAALRRRSGSETSLTLSWFSPEPHDNNVILDLVPF